MDTKEEGSFQVFKGMWAIHVLETRCVRVCVCVRADVDLCELNRSGKIEKHQKLKIG